MSDDLLKWILGGLGAALLPVIYGTLKFIGSYLFSEVIDSKGNPKGVITRLHQSAFNQLADIHLAVSRMSSDSLSVRIQTLIDSNEQLIRQVIQLAANDKAHETSLALLIRTINDHQTLLTDIRSSIAALQRQLHLDD